MQKWSADVLYTIYGAFINHVNPRPFLFYKHFISLNLFWHYLVLKSGTIANSEQSDPNRQFLIMKYSEYSIKIVNEFIALDLQKNCL